jgi:hypothetical protein
MDATNNRHCPFLTKPLPGCYCSRPQSIWAVLVVELCIGEFERCEIYRRNWPPEETAGGEPEDSN